MLSGDPESNAPSGSAASSDGAVPLRGGRWRRIARIASLVLFVAIFATTQVSLKWHWYGLYVLRSTSGRPLEITDDLLLGEGPRVLFGASFAAIRDFLKPDSDVRPRLDHDWDADEGDGTITNRLADGEVVQTSFGRYVDSDNKTPHGLFVGGALAEVAATVQQNESGMSLHDARGWHHIWCNVNEGLYVAELNRLVYPGEWKFEGSRMLVDATDRVVLRSEHQLTVGGVELHMERYAYFKAGLPFFRLTVNVTNVGDRPAHVSYAYGDEPWVGEFGSSEGNVGWTVRGIVPIVAFVDPREAPYAGIADRKTGMANFVAWEGSTPDVVYFSNHAGTPLGPEMGRPLTSNEIFIGLEWRDRTIEPGATFGVRLTLGVADSGPTRLPGIPAGALSVR